MRRRRLWLVSLTMIVTAAPSYGSESSDSAEPIPNHPILSKKLVFTLGIFYPRNTTSASLYPSAGGVGTDVNFENALDLDKRNIVPTAGVFWRVSDNWRVEAEYFKISRDGTRVTAEEVTWGDLTFNVGTTVNSSFDFSDLRISGAYSFFKRKDKELGVGLGLHVAGIKTQVQAASVGSDSTNVTAPLPVLNVYGMFALTNTWAVTLRSDWLSLTYGDYTGDVRNIEINALYQPFKNVGFGVGVRSLLIDVDISNTDWTGQAQVDFQGPDAFMTISF
jgi:hypothetical protein